MNIVQFKVFLEESMNESEKFRIVMVIVFSITGVGIGMFFIGIIIWDFPNALWRGEALVATMWASLYDYYIYKKKDTISW